jgi:hypothetical protein
MSTAAPRHIAITTSMRSTKMYSMHEALAREHMSELRRQASEHRVASESRAARRQRRLQWLARSTHQRS